LVPYPLPCDLPLMLSAFESFCLVLVLVILGFVVAGLATTKIGSIIAVLAFVVIGFGHLLGSMVSSSAGLAV
jgi:hypothetical protein